MLSGLHGVDEGHVVVVLDRRLGHEVHLGERLHQEPRVHELARKQFVVRVREGGAGADGAGRRVDLIIHGEEGAGRDRALLGTVERNDRHRRPAPICAKTSSITSSARVKITVIGCSWVITHRPVEPLAVTTLPGSMLRRPTRPAMGEVIRV